MAGTEVVFIGGCSGVGKSSVAFAMHDVLSKRDVEHAVIEGDFLDLAHPAPWKHRLAERNLAAVWRNYRELGYRRLIYTNTLSVLEISALVEAIGEVDRFVAFLLTAATETVEVRLGRRERGESLRAHVERSAVMADRLKRHVGDDIHRIETDGRLPEHIAEEVLEASRWS